MNMLLSVQIPAEDTFDYPVVVGPGALNYFEEYDFSKYSKVFILTDTTVKKLWLSALMNYVPQAIPITVHPGEQFKSVEVLTTIWQQLIAHGADRASLLLNLGGGVIGDMGGFAAATYMRGMRFIQIPTTLLAQVDASVGGKLAVDFGGVKNSIGVFTQPTAVIADTDTLLTLSERELQAGYAEVLKHGLITSLPYWQSCIAKPVSALSSSQLAEIVSGSIRIKASVVERDEKEGGLRKILNFGHTVGHAIESLSLEADDKNQLLHGEAVAIGMVVEAALSVRAGLLAPDSFLTIRNTIQSLGLPVEFPRKWDLTTLFSRMKLDKKNTKGTLRWTFLSAIGNSVFDQLLEDEIVSEVLGDFIAKAPE